MLQSVICKITGSGSTINVELGFEAGFAIVYNEDGDCLMHWSSKHGAAKGQKIVDSGSGATDVSEQATLGLSAYAGGQIVDSTGALTGTAHVVVDKDGTALTNGRRSKPGLTIGADTDINVNAQVLEILVTEQEATVRSATAAGYTDEG